MCCEDVKIGENAKSSVSYKAVAATVTPLCGPSPDREFLSFGSNNAGTFYVMPDNQGPALCGFQIAPGGQPLMMSVATHGAMVKEAWYGSCTVAATIIPIVEGIGDNICGDSG